MSILPHCKLADDLETGAAADIFYDAKLHGDDAASDTIDKFQASVAKAAAMLRQIDELDLSNASLTPAEIKTLQGIQIDIRGSAPS